MIRIGVLETGRPAELVQKRHGDFEQMFRRLFAQQPNLDFTNFAVAFGEPVPDPSACDAWIITGSGAAVYEDHAWIPPLLDFVRKSAEHPLLGICFGHQLMARAFGGKVERSKNGRGVGIHQYTLSKLGKQLLPEHSKLHIVAAHQDQVIQPPPNAAVLGGSKFCPNAILAYGNSNLSIQSHPEFDLETGLDVTTCWNGRSPVAAEITEAANATFKAFTPDSHRLAPVLQNFLTQRLLL